MAALTLTTAGIAALTGGANNAQVEEVQLREMAVGDGHGPGGVADIGRTTLRNEQDRASGADFMGTNPAGGRLSLVASFTPSTNYAVSEVGIFARIGDDDSTKFLLAYWAAPADAGALTRSHANTKLVIASVVDVSGASAPINITLDPDITFTAPANLLAMTDFPDAFSAHLYLRGNATGTAVEFAQAPPVVATEAALPAANAAVPKTWTVTNYNGTGRSALAITDGADWCYIEVGGGVGGVAAEKSANYSATAADDGRILPVDATAGARAISLPDLGSDDDGYTLTPIKTDSSANQVSVTPHGTDTINGAGTYALKDQYESVTVKWTGSTWLAIGGASTDWVRGFFGAASYREYDAAGSYKYTWEWGAENGLLVIIGGDGGDGGGAGGGGGGFRYNTGIGDNPPTLYFYGNDGTDGDDGTDGGDSTVKVGQTTYTGAKGAGGPGGSRAQKFDPPDLGGGGGGTRGDGGNPVGGIDMGPIEGNAGGYGARGTPGSVLTQGVTGMTRSTTLAITVGAAGSHGDGGDGGDPAERLGLSFGATAGGDGAQSTRALAPGQVIIIPLF